MTAPSFTRASKSCSAEVRIETYDDVGDQHRRASRQSVYVSHSSRSHQDHRTGARADFIVDAALVSRVHCRLTAGAADLEVVDLESTNGTFVNGARVDRALLKTGDRLGVGKVEFVVSRS